MERLQDVTLVTRSDKIHLLKNAQIDEQLDVYRRVIGDAEVPKKCQVKVRALKLDALFEAVDRQNEYGAQNFHHSCLNSHYRLFMTVWMLENELAEELEVDTDLDHDDSDVPQTRGLQESDPEEADGDNMNVD